MGNEFGGKMSIFIGNIRINLFKDYSWNIRNVNDGDDIFSNDMPIEFFHHLQNIVIDLTGKELSKSK